MNTNDYYQKQITELNNEARDIWKHATAHVKNVMSELMKYVRSIRKKSDKIATKGERLLDKRLIETHDNPKYEEYDKIADKLDEIQMIDIASDIFYHIHKVVEDNLDNYEIC